MKQLDRRLVDLEERAREAGRARRPWSTTWCNELYEDLSKLVGWGSGGRFGSAKDFERAHKGLLLAWATVGAENVVPPWELPGETVPMPPALGSPHHIGSS
ncbi:MAG TPA: hypothetical protein VJL29_05970 [Thermoguttaceae bacterium]|nr:hypothetical protein [Thermoguttaceae bacterium]